MTKAQQLIALCEAKTITILFNTEYNEYRAPGPKGTEAQAIYTDDKEDAIGSLIADWKRAGIEVTRDMIKFKKVDEWPTGMGESKNEKLSTADVKALFKAIDTKFATMLSNTCVTKEQVIAKGKEVGLTPVDMGESKQNEEITDADGPALYPGGKWPTPAMFPKMDASKMYYLIQDLTVWLRANSKDAAAISLLAVAKKYVASQNESGKLSPNGKSLKGVDEKPFYDEGQADAKAGKPKNPKYSQATTGGFAYLSGYADAKGQSFPPNKSKAEALLALTA